MKLTCALLALIVAADGSFLPKDVQAPKAVVASTAKESPHTVPVPAKPAVKLPTPHGHPEAGAAKKVAPKPEAAKVAPKVEVKPVVAKATDKVSPHVVPVPAKPAAKLPAPAGHAEGPQTKKVADAAKVAPKPAAKPVAKAAPLPDPASAKPKVQAAAKPVVAIAKPVAAKAAPLPDPASAKPKVEAKPVVKPVAKVEAKAVTAPLPHAAVAVAVTHKVEAKPAAKEMINKEPKPEAPKPAPTKTIHEHAVSAQKSADEAAKHLEAAKKAYAMTKANVQDTLKVGKKIEGTADKIKTLYTPPTKAPAPPKESAARSLAVPAFMAMVLAAVATSC